MRTSFIFGLVAAAACQPAAPPAIPVSPSAAMLVGDIDTLASRGFNGREAGTPGADSAADFIERRYLRLRLRPAFPSDCDSAAQCRPSYLQVFRPTSMIAHNVGALVEGTDPGRRDEYIVIGAHFDHLGHSPTFALDRDAGFVLRPGADDNASGTAAVLELSRRFGARPANRSILFVNFDAEEEGLLGSRAFLGRPPVPKEAMRLMLNLDMVGRLRRNRVFIESRQIDPTIRAIVDREARTAGIRAEFSQSDDLSDDASFADEGIPAVWISTGDHEDYHKASDVPARINVDGLTRIVDLVERVARTLADR